MGTIRKVDKVAEATTGGAALEKLGDVAKGAPEGSADKGAKLASGIEANKTGINALAELHPISPNASGGISSAKLNSSSYALIDLTPAEQSMARQVAVQGDQAGAITERLVNSVAQRQGMTILDGGKYGSNNGFDHVFQNADGTVTILLDSKQIVRGSTSLAEGAGGKMQLSSDWIRNVLLKVDQTSPAYQAVNAALNNGTLVKGVAGIDRMTGALTVVRVK